MNALILDYLTLSGYSRAAANFSREANLDPHQDNQSILTRQKIQNAIHRGHVHEAIEALNDLDPEVNICPGVPSFVALKNSPNFP